MIGAQKMDGLVKEEIRETFAKGLCSYQLLFLNDS